VPAPGAVVSTGSVYKPTSVIASRKTLSFKIWEGGRMKQVAGAVGDATLNLAVGQRARIDWTFLGVPVLDVSNNWVTAEAMPAQAPLTAPGYVVRSTTLTLGSYVPLVSQITLALGNSTSLREDITQASGHLHGFIGERNPTLKLDPEAALYADHNVYGLLVNGTTFALSCAITDGTNTITITAPRVQRIGVDHGERGGRLLDSIDCQLNASSGDDEWSIDLP
jgi:hypothetical protein